MSRRSCISPTHSLDAEGTPRPATDRGRLVKFLAKYGVEDLEFASTEVVGRLGDQLRAAVRAERSAIEGPRHDAERCSKFEPSVISDSHSATIRVQ